MPASLTPVQNFTFPERFVWRKHLAGGIVEQLAAPERTVNGEYSITGPESQRQGKLLITTQEEYAILAQSSPVIQPTGTFLLAPKTHISQPSRLFAATSQIHWQIPPDQPVQSPEEIRTANQMLFHFVQETPEGTIAGLRPPQIGALHAILGHWSVSFDPVTVVMPTGIGKTETMLALLAHGSIDRLLVVVPSNALRQQTYRKFLTWGHLPRLGVLGAGFLYPVVGRLDHSLTSEAEAEEFASPCNVVVATIQSLANSNPTALHRLTELCTHLFVDEAHHVAAPTWHNTKAMFSSKAVVQLTATPYRRDGKRVDGKIIYNYPLRKAQKEGYFAPIQYRAVHEFNPDAADQVIAATALEQLQQDLTAGFDHILMARTATIDRARQVVQLYETMAPELQPLFIHSDMKEPQQRSALQAIRNRTSRVIVCVNMLGEGFDLPQLKIAAIHDVHKSLAITLQFTGRFTRSSGDRLGKATMVANAGDISVEHALRQLYAEDADWNRIIQQLGEGAIGNQVAQSEFFASFPQEGLEVPLENILPKMSTVVYQTTCVDWVPEAIAEVFNPDEIFLAPRWSNEHKVALLVTREFEEIPWGKVRELQNVTWHLYLLYWDADTKLLYINSSNNDDLHENLAQAVSGQTATRIKGENVYRVLHNVRRLMLMNLGLLHTTGRAIRHTMHNGSDVAEQLQPAQLGNKAKTNLFGRGYEDGEKVSIGGCLKGRVWSSSAAKSVADWVAWCKPIGAKLLDDTITTASIVNGAIIPQEMTDRPSLIPLALDWNGSTYSRNTDAVFLRLADAEVPFYDTELQLISQETHGDIRFAIQTETTSIAYRAEFTATGVCFVAEGDEALALIGRNTQLPLSAFFKKEPPTIFFEQDALLEDGLLYKVREDSIGVYDQNAISVWDWQGVDLAKESQRPEKRVDSIQYRVLRQVCQDSAWEFVFDDDSRGEAADVVAVRRDGRQMYIDLYHCKFAIGGSVGARVEDLYAVCGQVHKCIRWRDHIEGLFHHLKMREASRIRDGKPSRIEKGDAKLLIELLNHAHFLNPVIRIFIVQPGLSKSKATIEQLRLLGATSTYLEETYTIPLSVIGSA